MSQQTTPSPLRENKMGVMPVGRLLANMALPMIVAMVIQALYNVVDSIYVSRVSESAVTALSLAFPVQNMQISVAVGIGVGVNAMMSKCLGQHDQEKVNQAAGNGMFLVLIALVVFMSFGIFGARPYFEMQSSVQETVESGIAYTSICCIFTLGIFAEILGERLLMSSGRTMYTMITQGVGALTNILLDPVFIFGYFGLPAMGITGAAVATVIGQWLAAALALIFNLKCNPDVQLGLHYIRPRKEILTPILQVSIPTMIMNGISSVMNFGMNQILQGFQETATGVFGVYFKLQSFFFMPLYGINNATISIVAYNYGARKPERITRVLKISCSVAVCIMTAGLLSFQLFPEALIGMFNPSETFMRIGCQALRVISFHFPLAAIGVALTASFQALGKGIYSSITSLCRQLVVLLPAAYLLSLTGQLDLVWWSFPIAEVVSCILTVSLFARIYRKMIRPLFLER